MNTPQTPRTPGNQPDIDIPNPKDILTVLDTFDQHVPPEINNPIERMMRPYEVMVHAGYKEVRKILLYAYYCSLRDSYESR